MSASDNLVRCSWCTGDLDYIKYHDNEWGVPLHDDKKLFELLTLEGAQAGLSWLTVLKKRDAYREVFYGFNIKKVSNLTNKDLNKLMASKGIIRNKLKILSVVKNAHVVWDIQKNYGSFNNYLWRYVDHIALNKNQIKKANAVAILLSKDLKKRGMNFVGPTICFAFIQANGMSNDHSKNCFRYNKYN
jgi:DNA-3-methyladenine glycosylase I